MCTPNKQVWCIGCLSEFCGVQLREGDILQDKLNILKWFRVTKMKLSGGFSVGGGANLVRWAPPPHAAMFHKISMSKRKNRDP